jgi:hypothetical protein
MALPLAIASAVVSGVGAISSGIAQGNAANYQAQVASNNATIARQNAVYAAGAGSAQATASGLKGRAREGAVRTGIAANGLDVNSGSAADVQTSQRELDSLDTATVANNAAIQVYGYKTQATGYEAQSKLDRAEATDAYASGAFKAAGDILGNTSVQSSLLSGAPKVPSNYQWMANPKADNYGDFEFG